MRLSNRAKIFLTGFLLICGLGGCGGRQAAENARVTPDPEAAGFPFPLTEPETFQAEIIVSANGAEQRMFVARSGAKRRSDYDYGGQNQRSILESDKKYLISFREKTYAVSEVGSGIDTNYGDPLASPLMSTREYAEFQKLGSEGGVTKYRARMRDSGASEIFVYLDESTGLPVKQEFFIINGGEQKLEYSVELKNISREIDTRVFEIPKGFRQTSIEEFRRLTARH